MVHKDDQGQVTICPKMFWICDDDTPDQRLLSSPYDCWYYTNQSRHSHFLTQQVLLSSQYSLGWILVFSFYCKRDDCQNSGGALSQLKYSIQYQPITVCKCGAMCTLVCIFGILCTMCHGRRYLNGTSVTLCNRLRWISQNLFILIYWCYLCDRKIPEPMFCSGSGQICLPLSSSKF